MYVCCKLCLTLSVFESAGQAVSLVSVSPTAMGPWVKELTRKCETSYLKQMCQKEVLTQISEVLIWCKSGTLTGYMGAC